MNAQPTTPNQIDLDYYQWLISQIEIGPKTKTFYGLFEIMHNTEFVWFIPNDDNRLADGRHLRNDFFRFVLRRKYRDQLNIEGVSVLEVLVALSKRVAFVAGGDAEYWAWRLIKNIRLQRMADPLSDGKIKKINETLENLIWRNYGKSGYGGFFPLERSYKDQTTTEIWYQMQEYVMEMEES